MNRAKENRMRNDTRRQIRLADRSCEIHATVHLQPGKRINIERALDSLLDALGGSAEHTDAIFIRFVRATDEG